MQLLEDRSGSCTSTPHLRLHALTWDLTALQITKEEGMLDMTLPAETLHNQVKASIKTAFWGRQLCRPYFVIRQYAPRCHDCDNFCRTRTGRAAIAQAQ